MILFLHIYSIGEQMEFSENRDWEPFNLYSYGNEIDEAVVLFSFRYLQTITIYNE